MEVEALSIEVSSLKWKHMPIILPTIHTYISKWERPSIWDCMCTGAPIQRYPIIFNNNNKNEKKKKEKIPRFVYFGSMLPSLSVHSCTPYYVWCSSTWERDSNQIGHYLIALSFISLYDILNIIIIWVNCALVYGFHSKTIRYRQLLSCSSD